MSAITDQIAKDAQKWRSLIAAKAQQEAARHRVVQEYLKSREFNPDDVRKREEAERKLREIQADIDDSVVAQLEILLGE